MSPQHRQHPGSPPTLSPPVGADGRAPGGCTPIPVPRPCSAGEMDLEGDTVLMS